MNNLSLLKTHLDEIQELFEFNCPINYAACRRVNCPRPKLSRCPRYPQWCVCFVCGECRSCWNVCTKCAPSGKQTNRMTRNSDVAKHNNVHVEEDTQNTEDIINNHHKDMTSVDDSSDISQLRKRSMPIILNSDNLNRHWVMKHRRIIF